MTLLQKLAPSISARRWLLESQQNFSRPLSFLRSYRREDALPDLLAGLTVAVVLLPQAIAYSLIAELPPQTGLYAAIIAAVVGALWGSSSHLHTGPTNAASLLVLSSLVVVAAPGTPQYIAAAGLMTVMVGVARLVMGMARLGVLVNFVSDSVVIGFTAGAGILISANQLRHLFKLDLPSSTSFFETLSQAIVHLPEAHLNTTLIGFGTIVVMVAIKRLRPTWPSALIGMAFASAIVVLPHLERQGVEVLGELPRSLPPLANLPLLDLELIGRISVGALAISAIGLVEAISIARSISAQSGEHLDSNQEFIGQGLANIAAGIFSGYTCSGSFTRTAVNYTAGGRTAMSSVFSGLWVLLALLLFAPLTAYLPRAALSGVLIVTAYGMVDRKEMKRIWQSSIGDSAIMAATILATLLLPLEFAVLSGMVVSFARFIVKTSRPDVYAVLPDHTYRHFIRQESLPGCPQLGVITVAGSLYFGAAHYVEDAIRDNLEEHPEQAYLLLRMNLVDHTDISGIHMLEAIVRLYRQRGGDLYLSGVRPQVKAQMDINGFSKSLGDKHFLEREDAIGYLFHKVMQPSVCIYECNQRIFAECQALPKQSLAEELTIPAEIPDHDVQHWLPTELKEILDGKPNGEPVWLVDVREGSEYSNGHIPQARLLPLRTIPQEGKNLPKDHTLVLVCRSGRRSRMAAYILQDMGYTRVYNLHGGMLAWEAAGYPIAVE